MSVPVLSVQIVVTHPKVSAESNDFTSHFLFKILCIPTANTTVRAIKSHSGIAPTANATAVVKISTSHLPVTAHNKNTITTTQITIHVICLENQSSCFWSGVSSCSVFKFAAIFPISVFTQVFVTLIVPCHHWTIVPMNTVSVSSFLSATDSPVNIASCTKSLFASTTSPSAEILSPL